MEMRSSVEEEGNVLSIKVSFDHGPDLTLNCLYMPPQLRDAWDGGIRLERRGDLLDSLAST